MSNLDSFWVAPCLSDGLGNRLFQYACAKDYSEKYNKKLVFFLPRSRRTGHGKFDTIFKLFPEVEVLETDISWNEIDEDNYYSFEELPNLRKNIVIKGSRQNYKYFKDTIIKPSFERIISEERLQYLNNRYLKDKENLFFIHVRLGDYRNLPHYQIDIAKYYSEALKIIPNNSKLLVFSDEPEVAKQIFPNLEVCEERDEVEILYLMSNCLLGAIVANSTFSYWGSYFAHKKSKSYTAIFPYRLMTTEHDYSEYFPPYSTVLKF
jgi:hypothetical protein